MITTPRLRILMGTDYSEPSATAAKYAVQFARDTQSELIFLHVYPHLSNAQMAFYEPMWLVNRADFELWKLECFANGVCGAVAAGEQEVPIRCMVAEGNTASTVLETAAKENASLIMTGTHGAGKLRETFMGSNTWDIMKTAAVPVLAVPEAAKYKAVKKIVFAVQGDEHEIVAADRMVKTFSCLPLSLQVVHMTERSGWPGYEEQAFIVFMAKMREKLTNVELTPVFRYAGNLVEGLNDFCNEAQADWLVMCPEKLSLVERWLHAFSSVSRSMSFHTRQPMLVMPGTTVIQNENR